MCLSVYYLFKGNTYWSSSASAFYMVYVHLVVLWVSIRSLVLSYLYGCCSLAEERLYDHSEVIFCVVASGQHHAVHLLAVLFRDVKQLLLFFSVLWKGGTFTEETGKQTILICQTMPLSFKGLFVLAEKNVNQRGEGWCWSEVSHMFLPYATNWPYYQIYVYKLDNQ